MNGKESVTEALPAVPSADAGAGDRPAEAPRAAAADGPQGPGRHTPGHPTEELPHPPSRPAPPPFNSFVTRNLCATTYLQGSYAEQVADTMLDPTFTATAPNWGVDMVALTRHARRAILWRRARDRHLRYLLIATGVLALLAVSTWPYHVLTPFAAIELTLAVVVAGWFGAWLEVFHHYDRVRMAALEVTQTQQRVRDCAPALDPEVEHWLVQHMNTNTVVFGAYSPFVGDGQPLDTWTMSFDLETAADWVGDDRVMRAFTIRSLYEHLLARVPGELGGIPAGWRLYVNGTAAKSIPGLIPPPDAKDTRPACVLPAETVEHFIDSPTETARTYAYFAKPAWNEDIRINLLLRARLSEGRLFVEGRSHALLPLQAVFRDVKLVPANPRRAWIVVARPTTAVVTPLWLTSINRQMDWKYRVWRFMRRIERLRRDHLDGVNPINYGAGVSLREDAADAGELKYYATVDEVQAFREMTRTVLDSLRTFLKEHHVDMTQFTTQSEDILSQTSARLHSVKGAAGNFGKNSTVTVSQGIVG